MPGYVPLPPIFKNSGLMGFLNIFLLTLRRLRGEHEDLKDESLAGFDIQDVDIYGCRFTNIDFTEAIGVCCSFEGSSFYGCDFTEACFQNCNFQHCKFVNCSFKWSTFSGTNFKDSTFSNCDITESEMSYTDFSGSDMTKTNMKDSDLRGANFSWTNLSGANLAGALFYDLVSLRGTNLTKTKLKRAVLSDSE